VAILTVMLLAACSAGPERSLPAPSFPEKFVNAPSHYTLPRLPDRWWTTLGIGELDELVERVLNRNYDLREASWRIRELAARFGIRRSERWPRAELGLSGSRQRLSFVGTPYPGASGYIYGEFRGRLGISYEVDLWRRISAEAASARWEWLASTEDRRALAISLVSETVSLYLRAAFTRCELDLLRRERGVLSRYLALVEGRFEAGRASASEVLALRRRLAALSAEIPEKKRTLSGIFQQLALLAGDYPSGRSFLRFPEGICSLTVPLPPPGLPSELLRRRPDIRAAEARLRAARARVRAARAARFPRLVLTAEEGRVSNALSDLLAHRNRLWSLTFTLTHPLFEGGKLAAGERAERAALREAEARYASTLLTAFREVEFALLSEARLRRRLSETEREVRASETELRFCTERFGEGLVTLPVCLEKRLTLLELKRRLLSARLALLLNRVSLFEALGGGFSVDTTGGGHP